MMIQSVQTFFYLVVVVTAYMSVYYSFKYRRETDARKRGIFTSKMNVSMGIMLIAFSIILLFLLKGYWVRISIGSIFLVLGLFNFFAGLRSMSYFARTEAERKNVKKDA